MFYEELVGDFFYLFFEFVKYINIYGEELLFIKKFDVFFLGLIFF